MAGPRKPLTDDKSEQMGEMKATLDYLKEDFGLFRQELKVMSQTLAVNTRQLEVHIEGVQLARQQNDILKRDVDNRMYEINANIEPIKVHVTKVQLWGKIAAWTAGTVIAPMAIWGAIKIVETLLVLGK